MTNGVLVSLRDIRLADALVVVRQGFKSWPVIGAHVQSAVKPAQRFLFLAVVQADHTGLIAWLGVVRLREHALGQLLQMIQVMIDLFETGQVLVRFRSLSLLPAAA